MRAQWAGAPFLWHIYQQEEDAHMVKLDGFLDHYLPLPAPAGHGCAVSTMPSSTGEHTGELWGQWPQYAAKWQQHGRSWPQRLLADGDLVTRLVGNFRKPYIIWQFYPSVSRTGIFT